MKVFFRIVLLLLIIILVNNNQYIYSQEIKGKLEIHQDQQISALVQKHIQFNSRQKGVMDGYRIQIYFDSGNESKKRAVDTRSEFQMKHPDITAYLSFQEPFFKVRVGDFRYRVEADGYLEKIKSEYPNGFTVKDRIYFPRLD